MVQRPHFKRERRKKFGANPQEVGERSKGKSLSAALIVGGNGKRAIEVNEVWGREAILRESTPKNFFGRAREGRSPSPGSFKGKEKQKHRVKEEKRRDARSA